MLNMADADIGDHIWLSGRSWRGLEKTFVPLLANKNFI